MILKITTVHQILIFAIILTTIYVIGLLGYGIYYKLKYNKAPKPNYILMGFVIVFFGVLMFIWGLNR